MATPPRALNQAQLEIMACHELLRTQAHVGNGSNGLFWIDPWSTDGQKVAVKIRPSPTTSACTPNAPSPSSPRPAPRTLPHLRPH